MGLLSVWLTLPVGGSHERGGVTPTSPRVASTDVRFAGAARMLESPTAMERIAGALVLGALGDEHPSTRRACAGLRCAHLRTVPDGWDAEALAMPRAERNVRDEITAVIAQRLRLDTGDPRPSVRVDFARAVPPRSNFTAGAARAAGARRTL